MKKGVCVPAFVALLCQRPSQNKVWPKSRLATLFCPERSDVKAVWVTMPSLIYYFGDREVDIAKFLYTFLKAVFW